MKKWIIFDKYIISMSALFLTLSVTYSGQFSNTGTFEKAIVGLDIDRDANLKQVSDWGTIDMAVTKNHGVGDGDIFLKAKRIGGSELTSSQITKSELW